MAAPNIVAKSWAGLLTGGYSDPARAPSAPTLDTPSMTSDGCTIAFTGGTFTTLIPQWSDDDGDTWNSLSSDTSSPLTFTSLSAGSYQFRALTNGLEEFASNVVGGTVSSGEAPAYTPLKTFSFEGGALGSSMAGVDGFEAVTSGTNSAANTRSNEVPGPYGDSRVGKIAWSTNGQKFFGGRIVNPNIRPAEGSEIWIRVWHYFPTEFCFQNNGEGDAWGNTKWLRLQWGTGGVRHTFQTGNWSSSACNTTATLWGCTMESIGGTLNPAFSAPKTIVRGQWVCLEWYVLFSTDIGNGKIRGWVDDQYCGEATCVTMPASLDLTEIFLGDYINGGAKAGNTFYVGQGIITTSTPDATDSGGRPRIGAARMVGDFA